MSINKVILSGRITKDPEVRYTQSGMTTMRFTLAVDRMQKDANGQKIADFITCAAFGQPADFISKYIKKGFMLGIVGRLQTGSFKGQDGQVKYTEDVVVESIENFTQREASNQPPQQPQANQYRNPQYGQPQTPPQQTYTATGVSDDDVPF